MVNELMLNVNSLFQEQDKIFSWFSFWSIHTSLTHPWHQSIFFRSKIKICILKNKIKPKQFYEQIWGKYLSKLLWPYNERTCRADSVSFLVSWPRFTIEQSHFFYNHFFNTLSCFFSYSVLLLQTAMRLCHLFSIIPILLALRFLYQRKFHSQRTAIVAYGHRVPVTLNLISFDCFRWNESRFICATNWFSGLILRHNLNWDIILAKIPIIYSQNFCCMKC